MWIQFNIPINITVFRYPNDSRQQDNYLQSGVELSSGESKENPAIDIGQSGIWTKDYYLREVNSTRWPLCYGTSKVYELEKIKIYILQKLGTLNTAGYSLSSVGRRNQDRA